MSITAPLKETPLKKYTAVLLWLLLCFVFLSPVLNTVFYLSKITTNQHKIPEFTVSWHKSISNNIGKWANERVYNQTASDVQYQNISGTEWPIFSSVYYLWATEALELNSGLYDQIDPPSIYAKDSIDAVIKLVVDPGHASWVKKHWGDNYLSQENIFYRMLLISGITSYQTITKNRQYEQMLRSQVVSLMHELDNSPYGLLDDYPGQCYTIDIIPAIASIARAGKLPGIDTLGFIDRAKRGFIGQAADPMTQLPSYRCNKHDGKAVGPSRGVGVSYSLIWSAEIWPELLGVQRA